MQLQTQLLSMFQEVLNALKSCLSLGEAFNYAEHKTFNMQSMQVCHSLYKTFCKPIQTFLNKLVQTLLKDFVVMNHQEDSTRSLHEVALPLSPKLTHSLSLSQRYVSLTGFDTIRIQLLHVDVVVQEVLSCQMVISLLVS